MKGWILDFWQPLKSDNLPVQKELSKEHKGNKRADKQFLKLLEAVETFGPSLMEPLNKYLGDGLFELRNSSCGKRYYYCETDFTYVDSDDGEEKKIILLLGAVGSKNNKKEQQRDIQRARERLSSIAEENISLLSDERGEG